MKKILIIEDEKFLSEMYRTKFESEGLEVLIALDGEEGVELARSNEIDLVLLDLIMPKMDGFEVLKVLKSDKKTKNLKVVIMSNLIKDDRVKKALAGGAEDYLIKSSMTPSQIYDKVVLLLK